MVYYIYHSAFVIELEKSTLRSGQGHSLFCRKGGERSLWKEIIKL